MAKRKARKHGLTSRSGRKRTGKRPTAIRAGRRKTAKRAKATPKKRAQTAKGSSAGKAPAARGGKVPRLNRARRTLDEETVRNTPPSSLNMVPMYLSYSGPTPSNVPATPIPITAVVPTTGMTITFGVTLVATP